MSSQPLTRPSLLVRLRDPRDASAWTEFAALYGPVVYSFARRRGLQDADAADLMQEVLRSVSRSAGKLDYDPLKGTFRGWLFTVTRNKIYNFLEGRRRQERATGDSDARQRLEEQAQPEPDKEDWDMEYERRVAGMAMDRVKTEFQPSTWEAFRLTALEGASAADAGKKTGLSPGAVYVAKSRVLARVRDEVQRLRAEE